VSAVRGLYDGYPLSTDDRVPLEYMAPITDRDVEGGRTSVLAWIDLVDYMARVRQATSSDTDPYLEGLAAAMRRQVDAGAEFEAYEANRRLGRTAIAARHLSAYEALLTPAPGESGD
jgi:hypothetical protein